MSLQIWTGTNVGRVRNENQDRVQTMTFEDGHLVVVCDGMGGENAGSTASQIAVQAFCDRFSEGYRASFPPLAVQALMEDAVSRANQQIFEKSLADPACAGMGTTCVAVFVGQEAITLVNVGDSRAYAVEAAGLRQLTHDHTVVQMLLDQERISPEEAEFHPQRHMLTRAVGVEPSVRADCWILPREPELQLLLCSDGLSGFCTEQELYEILRTLPPKQAAEALIDLANQKGGRDNITLALLKD